MRALIARTDGACRGNPGPASIGVALYDASRDGAAHPSAQPDATISAAIGTTTNNVAEWKAVISAIELAAELGASELQLFLDSKLVVEQLNGRWRVRDAKLAPLCDEARARLTRFAVWSATHVPREENHQADALANEGLDRALRGGPAWVVRRPDDVARSRGASSSNGLASDDGGSSRSATTLTLLGTGASRGVPRVGGRCEVCISKYVRNQRLRSSLLMEWRDAVTATSRAVIVDPGMDLRQQSMRFGITRLDGALITHIHVDHTGGIDELRAYTDAQEEVLDVGAGPETCTELLRRWEYAFDGRTAPGHGIPSLRLVEAVPHIQLGGRAFEAIPLIHGRRPAHGWRSGAVAYLTDVSGVSQASRERLRDLEILIVSALRDLPHPTHQTVEEALALIADLGPRLAILTHLDHDLDYQELSARLPQGVLAGFDGLVVEVAAR
ncbi:MAG: MBL fold metallo-hydrolase [Candidatus Limnocylindrus sp.]